MGHVFSVLVRLLRKGAEPCVFPGRGNASRCTVTDAVREGGAEREQWRLLCSLPDFSHFPRYPQAKWAPLVLISRWGACARSRPLWVCPMTSPVGLGVSPTAASTPTGVFSQRFEALFPHLEPWVVWSVSFPSCSSRFICTDHLLYQRPHHCTSSLPGCPSPPLLLVWVSVSSLTPWLSDFHIVRFSGSSGCFLF